jgi:hypothetical protein
MQEPRGSCGFVSTDQHVQDEKERYTDYRGYQVYHRPRGLTCSNSGNAELESCECWQRAQKSPAHGHEDRIDGWMKKDEGGVDDPAGRLACAIC